MRQVYCNFLKHEKPDFRAQFILTYLDDARPTCTRVDTRLLWIEKTKKLKFENSSKTYPITGDTLEVAYPLVNVHMSFQSRFLFEQLATDVALKIRILVGE